MRRPAHRGDNRTPIRACSGWPSVTWRHKGRAASTLFGYRPDGIYKWHVPSQNGIMTTLTLDRSGRLLLPKLLRDELNLAPGDTLELETSGELITLQPVRSASPLQKERGVWVFRTGEKLFASTVEQTLRQVQEDRDRAALGHKS